MIDPLAEPPARKTTHGATMSPRLSRLYTWLQANGVGLSDFSTDRCVAREMPNLERLRDALEDLRAGVSSSTLRERYRYLDDLAADLRNIMRRTPDARVTR